MAALESTVLVGGFDPGRTDTTATVLVELRSGQVIVWDSLAWESTEPVEATPPRRFNPGALRRHSGKRRRDWSIPR